MVGLRLPDMTRDHAEESLGELASLTRASGARVPAAAEPSAAGLRRTGGNVAESEGFTHRFRSMP